MKKGWLFLTAAAVVMAGAVIIGEKTTEPELGDMKIYYPYRMQSEERRESAIGSEPYQGDERFAGPRTLLDVILKGPEDERLENPFPRGVTVENWRWDPERKGNLQIQLSEQYGGLTDISLTIADYCIVLTLCQLPNVETVEITSVGHSSNYRAHQLLSADEVLLTDTVAVDGALS